jgi:crotonobetainyl-CoA:carnitine CoA-transferase CaiB-like acyl-CoA transferase
MHDVAQMLAHEQVQAVGMLGALPLPGAPQHQAMGLPFSSQGRRGRSGQPPPVLGANTDAVLTALGLHADELAALRQQRVVD